MARGNTHSHSSRGLTIWRPRIGLNHPQHIHPETFYSSQGLLWGLTITVRHDHPTTHLLMVIVYWFMTFRKSTRRTHYTIDLTLQLIEAGRISFHSFLKEQQASFFMLCSCMSYLSCGLFQVFNLLGPFVFYQLLVMNGPKR